MNKKGVLLFILVLLFVSTSLLRLSDLSYSHFQGDEIRALFTKGDNLFSFLLKQKKGPVQYLTTFVVQSFFTNPSELNFRLPFAVAGILSVFVFYLAVKKMFNIKTAVVSSFLFSFNGLFVAFSRIVQYQAFTIFFYLLAIYFFVSLEKEKKVKYLYLAIISISLSFLSHYDALFVFPICAYYFFKWVGNSFSKTKLMHTTLAGLLFILLVGSFYLPFFLNEQFGNQTASYLFMRITGGEGQDKITNTKITYELYNPLFSVYFLTFFGIVGVFLKKLRSFPVLIWYSFSYILLNFLTTVPGTHIYNYIIPLIILCALGITSLLESASSKLIKVTLILVLIVVNFFSFFQSFVLFIDHNPEYPYFEKKLFRNTLSMPSKKYHLSVFGFPYNRRLDEVGKYISEIKNISEISSNENSKIVRFYIKPTYLEPKAQHFRAYIYVYSPQSLLTTKSAKVSGLTPEIVYFSGNTPVSEVYLIKEVL